MLKLSEQLAVGLPVADVWSFFMDLSNLPRWDRGVAQVEVTSGDGGVGSTFDMIGHGGRGRMSYEVTELDENRRHAAVTRTGQFKWAEWRLTLDPIASGTNVTCTCRFCLRLRFVFLAPVLLLVGTRGIRRDLALLKNVIETDANQCLGVAG